jgi:hypothetical protein
MQITVEIKTVYGNKTIYPVCEKGEYFAQIAGTKTLTHGTVSLIQKLGYEIQVKNQSF